MKRVLSILSLVLFYLPLQASPSSIQIDGKAQLWKKDCKESYCGLPEPVGAAQSFQFTMMESPAPGSVATKSISLDFEKFVVELQYYWVSKTSRPGLNKGYISIQQKLWQKSPKRLLAEFGQYRGDTGDIFIPIGYIASPIFGNVQYGASFTHSERRRR